MEELLPGATYKVQTQNETQTGVYINQNKNTIFLKLPSGYNIGVHKDKIENVEQTKKPTKQEDIKAKKITDPEILILHTGGTIASKVDYKTGAVTSKFTPQDIMNMFPGISKYGVIDSVLISNMPSDDMNFNHYNKMGEEIVNAIKNKPSLKGIILTHGTDTLHYTSAALRFSLENIKTPVILVGSQRSSDRPSSDAYENLMNAAFAIQKLNEKSKAGVFVCMHESADDENNLLFNGVNVRKNHTSKRSAFKQINQKPAAKVNFKTESFEEITPISKNDESFEYKPYNPNKKVGIIKARPGLLVEELKPYQNFDALILEGTGLGHFPINKFDEHTTQNLEVYAFIKDFAKTKPVAITTQTVHGRINMNVYTPGRKLRDANVLGHNTDIITETAYTKMQWLVSNYPDVREVRKLYETNLRGEITKRTIPK